MMKTGTALLSGNCLLLRRKHGQLATRFSTARLTAVRTPSPADLIWLLGIDLNQISFQESVATLFDRFCRLRLAGTGIEPEYCEAACTLETFPLAESRARLYRTCRPRRKLQLRG